MYNTTNVQTLIHVEPKACVTYMLVEHSVSCLLGQVTLKVGKKIRGFEPPFIYSKLGHDTKP